MNKKIFLIALIVIILAIGVFVFIRNNNSKQTNEVETMEGTYKLVDIDSIEKDVVADRMSKIECTMEIKPNKTFTMQMSYKDNNTEGSLFGSYDNEYLYVEKTSDLMEDGTVKEQNEDEKMEYTYERDKIKIKTNDYMLIFQKEK